MLYIVATPIGNMEDITIRAIRILEECDLIAAEDTRRTGLLLKKHEISKGMVSYNDHNREKRIPYLLKLMKEGKDIALVSDAGTPGISDPGFRLISETIKNRIDVSSIPGASALISALVASGLPTDKFTFYGFLPKKKKKKMEAISSVSGTCIFYESPYRIEKTLALFEELLPDSRMCLARELTKRFEEFIRGTPSEIIQKIGKRKLKGEIVLVVYG